MRTFKLTFSLTALVLLSFSVFLNSSCSRKVKSAFGNMKADFTNPPPEARPGVYWYFMDGNLSKEGMTKDLESMKRAGIGNVLFLEVNVGIPRGPVDFLSEQWQDLFTHAVRETERLGIRMTLGIGPGWTGSGGPWVPASHSMQHLVSSITELSGPGLKTIKLSLPKPKAPFFGEEGFTPDLHKKWKDFYEDVMVLAFPTPPVKKRIEEIDEKALYYRSAYSSYPNVKQFLPSIAVYNDLPKDEVVAKDSILDLSRDLKPDGTLVWNMPAGNWTIMRFGRTNNGAVTRPAPLPGVGFEADKFDTAAIDDHLEKYIGKLLKKIGKPDSSSFGGLKMLHMDSWEMGSQNWTPNLRKEFIKRRGYDPLPFFPVYSGYIVGSLEISERFLWDLRLTSQELIVEYHAKEVKKYAHKNGLGLSIEPYDMNPTADLELGSVADVPMCEFWSKDYGFKTVFSCIEAVSLAHVMGEPLVPAESFTALESEGRKQNPSSMKDQGDWAFATGINGFFYHTFQHQFLNDSLKPGMTMGPYGVHWDRGQTWWPMADGYHNYISRCQYILRKGLAVADILYLTPEGAPHIFRPPSSALTEGEMLPDRKGYNFDGCSPGQLYSASVKDHKVVFPGGASYQLLVMPAVETMTPALLKKIQSLISDGAIVVGSPPLKSPGLSNFPACDAEVQSLSREIWKTDTPPSEKTTIIYGNGKIIWGGEFSKKSKELFPSYELTKSLLKEMGVAEDFTSDAPIRYTHRSLPDMDIYFVSNRTGLPARGNCTFRSGKGFPELWDPMTGTTRSLPQFSTQNGLITVPLEFAAYQSYFIVFSDVEPQTKPGGSNFPKDFIVSSLAGSWDLSFDPKWGGPAKVHFDSLRDWTLSEIDGIKYYSGIAVYSKKFDLPEANTIHEKDSYFVDLGNVKNMARVRLNGQDLGVVWAAPFKVDVTHALKQKDNELEIEVANLWQNRLIGDERLPDDGIKNGKWPEWLVKGQNRTSRRYSFTTHKFYTKDSTLLPSGLTGPVTILKESFE